MNKPAPLFDRSFCIELAGGRVYQQAEKLFESQAVESSEWKSPFLVGVVKGAQGKCQARLNLRSTVFVENDCSCVLGRKGKICAHSIAVCLHYQALQREADLSAQAGSTMESADAVDSDLDRPELQSIQLSDEGEKLRVLVFLPPNLEEAAERNAIVVKIEAATGRSIVPVNQLSRDTFYSVSEGQKRHSCSWSRGAMVGWRACLSLPRYG